MANKFKVGSTINVRDRMQKQYSYELSAGMGRAFPDDFKPAFTPKEMLAQGVFEGKYLNDCHAEFPASWFDGAKLSDTADVELNCFGIKSRQPLSVWRDKGWIIGDDPRGWFQWYCRYYLGRRDPKIDAKQMQRWRSFARHRGQIKQHCEPYDYDCRPRQRQALLQWSYDPFF